MAAATDNRKYLGDGSVLTRGQVGTTYFGPVADNVHLYVGTLAGQLLSDTGNPPAIQNFVGDGTMRCVGFNTLEVDNTQPGHFAGKLQGHVVSQVGTLVDKNAGGGSAFTTADMFKPVFGVDNQTCSKLVADSAGGVCIGIFVGIDRVSSNPLVLVDPMLAKAWAEVGGTNVIVENAAGTFATTLSSAATAARTATFPDNTGTVAMTNLAQSFSAAQTFTAATPIVVTQAVATSGSPTAFLVTAGAHTTLAAGVEDPTTKIDASATKQFATGALATQRENLFLAPTLAFVGASTVTNAATLAISGAPIAGTNATITNPMAFWIQGGAVNLGEATVTQITSITTGVTCNGASGVITTVNASTAAQAVSTFTVTNNAVLAGSVVQLTLGAYGGTFGTNGTPILTVSAVAAGSFNVTIFNAHAANALSGTLKINFAVL